MSRADPTGIAKFGDALLFSGDLDPVYIALNRANLPYGQLSRLCLAYWCFYHLGAAAKMSEASGGRFWDLMHAAAVNTSNPDGSKPWPRGAERRHFRGQQAILAVEELIDKYKKPEDAVHNIIGSWFNPGATLTFSSVSAAAKSHRGFGDWIAYKIADMTERVLDHPVDFSDCALGIYKDPRQGAALAYLELMQPVEQGALHPEEVPAAPWELQLSDEQMQRVCDYSVAFWRKRTRTMEVPGLHRPVGIQEVETIFCKYKSHLKGHYPLGKDTVEVYHGLSGWGRTADALKGGLAPLAAQYDTAQHNLDL